MDGAYAVSNTADSAGALAIPHGPVLVAQHISKAYSRRRWFSRADSVGCVAVRDVSLSLNRGRILGLVGESGSGKSTLARCLACLERPQGGRVYLDGVDLYTMNGKALRQARQQIQIVFQGSAATLNPRFSSLDIVVEPLLLSGRTGRREQHERALLAMESVGLPRTAAQRRPSELSGGQRQRLALARALVLNPKVLILDESLTGLDLPLQAQIVNLLLDFQSSWSLALLFITHDLRLASHAADELAVMKDGSIVECGSCEEVVGSPKDAHTRALLAAACQLGWDWS